MPTLLKIADLLATGRSKGDLVFPVWPVSIIYRGPCDRTKNSIPIENFNPGLRFSISIENFNLDRKLQSPGVFLFTGPTLCRRVSNAALANAALVLSSKHWKIYSRGGGGSVEK